LRQENEALRHQASFSLSNPFPIFEFDFDGCEIYLNPAARQTLTELGLVDARPFFPSDFAHLKTILEKTELYRSTRRVNIEGHLFEEEIYLSKASGTIHLYVFDITKHLQNDAELNQSKLEKKHNVLHSPSSDMQGKSVDPGEVAYTISEQLSTQEALLQSEACFRMVLKNVPVTVAAQDKDLRFIWAYNQRTVDPTAVIGKTDTDLFPPEVASWTMKLKRQVLETERELHEQGWVSSGGQRLYLDLFVEPLKNKDGEVIGVGVATVDLTPIKLAEQALSESEARYRTLFDTMTEGFAIDEMIFDENGAPWDYRFLDVNPAFERQTGLSRRCGH
jgi:PAS domain S-box-containing protein